MIVGGLVLMKIMINVQIVIGWNGLLMIMNNIQINKHEFTKELIELKIIV
jgi:hypothetical protein